jgi:hypothetical protein
VHDRRWPVGNDRGERIRRREFLRSPPRAGQLKNRQFSGSIWQKNVGFSCRMSQLCTLECRYIFCSLAKSIAMEPHWIVASFNLYSSACSRPFAEGGKNQLQIETSVPAHIPFVRVALRITEGLPERFNPSCCTCGPRQVADETISRVLVMPARIHLGVACARNHNGHVVNISDRRFPLRRKNAFARRFAEDQFFCG